MKIFDLHNDVLTVKKNWTYSCKILDRNYHVATVIFKGDRSFKQVENLSNEFLKRDFKNLRLAYEDIGYENGFSLDKLIRYNPLYVSLTWNGENRYGFGCNENKRLKAEGISAVKYLNKKAVVIDTAHLSERGFYDVIDNADRVINSHTAFNGVYSYKRNISDLQIKEIIEKEGIIGLTFVPDFLTDKSASICDVVKHIDYFLQKFSYKHLCIGSDFNGTQSLPIGLNGYGKFINLFNELIKLGYSEQVIESIFYLNAKRFFDDR